MSSILVYTTSTERAAEESKAGATPVIIHCVDCSSTLEVRADMLDPRTPSWVCADCTDWG